MAYTTFHVWGRGGCRARFQISTDLTFVEGPEANEGFYEGRVSCTWVVVADLYVKRGGGGLELVDEFLERSRREIVHIEARLDFKLAYVFLIEYCANKFFVCG